jgi:tRNA-(ms[2]io[6]A)-hydroxylase
MPDAELRDFYTELFRVEALHHGVYLELARTHCGRDAADQRLEELLEAEAEIVRHLPIRAALH